MKIIVGILFMFFVGLAHAAEVIVETPEIVISGIFRDGDGRVKEHEFPVVLELKNDGRVTGHYESWMEATLTNGSSKLSILEVKVQGQWVIKNNEFQISLIDNNMLPDFKFREFNGMAVRVVRQPSSKLDVGDGK